MSKAEIFTCDACGKDMPTEGSVLILQWFSKEEYWDLCEECEDKIVKFIEGLGENNGSI